MYVTANDQKPPLAKSDLEAIESFLSFTFPASTASLQLRYQQYSHSASIHILAYIDCDEVAQIKSESTWQTDAEESPYLGAPLEGRMSGWPNTILSTDQVLYENLGESGYRTILIRKMPKQKAMLCIACLTDLDEYPVALQNRLHKGAIRMRGFEFKGSTENR